MDTLIWIVFLLLCLCIIGAIVIGLGVGIGYGLSALIPGLDLGFALVAGAIFAIGVLDLFLRYLSALSRTKPTSSDDVVMDDPLVVVPRSFFQPRPAGKKRKKSR